jgi:hypothetical protein
VGREQLVAGVEPAEVGDDPVGQPGGPVVAVARATPGAVLSETAPRARASKSVSPSRFVKAGTPAPGGAKRCEAGTQEPSTRNSGQARTTTSGTNRCRRGNLGYQNRPSTSSPRQRVAMSSERRRLEHGHPLAARPPAPAQGHRRGLQFVEGVGRAQALLLVPATGPRREVPHRLGAVVEDGGGLTTPRRLPCGVRIPGQPPRGAQARRHGPSTARPVPLKVTRSAVDAEGSPPRRNPCPLRTPEPGGCSPTVR